MDQNALVEVQIYDGRRFVERFTADGNPVEAAFWAKPEESSWFLHLATELVEREGPAAAYRAVHASLQKLDACCITSSVVKVISPKKPIAREILSLMARRSDRSAIHVAGAMWVEPFYIYPRDVFTMQQPDPMTRDEVSQEILRLMNRSPGTLHWSRILLKNGTAFEGSPFSMQMGSRRPIEVHFTVDGERKPVIVGLDEIASIR